MIAQTKQKLYLSVLTLFLWYSPVAFALQDQVTPFAEQEVPEIWQPAPTPTGAINWSMLMDVEIRTEKVNNFLQYIPTFTPMLKSFDGTKTKLNGYMVPLDASEFQSHFILMAYPHACPFHMPGGPGGFVEIIADIPVEFSYGPVLIEGQFELLTDFSNGLFYRIKAASEVTD